MYIEVNEFDFDGKKFIVAKDIFKDGLRKVWPSWRVMRPERVELKFKEVGDQRWLCYVKLPHAREEEFLQWLSNHLDNRFMLIKIYDYVDDNVTLHYELRGGDPKDKTLLALCWA